ncbi:MAG: hypothetical protein GC191_12360 [Azospirillum sp.]|nr:hypothetical protein [Azospirillum sp.]
MVSIALLSHRGGNIGHDLMACGIEEILSEAFGQNRQITHFEQHRPFEVYPPYHWLRLVNRLRHGRWSGLRWALYRATASLWPQARRLDFDLAIACGGPNLVAGAARVPEMALLFHHMNGAFWNQGVPLIDAAVGSCFPWTRRPERIEDEADRQFYRKAWSYCAKVTVREPLAQKLMNELGTNTEVIPCAAMASGRRLAPAGPAGGDGSIVINYQRRGANEDWGQNVDAEGWRSTLRTVIDRLGQRHRMIMLAHSDEESRLAKDLAPELPCVQPTSLAAYAQLVQNAKAGLVSRIHAAIALAGAGVPAAVVGTDSRLGTVAEIGLPSRFVADADAGELVDTVEGLVASRSSHAERLIALREQTVRRYAELFRGQSRA